MSDEGPDNLTLRYLRGMDSKLDQVREDRGDLKQRLTSVQDGLLGARRDIVHLCGPQVRMHHTFDRFDERRERIERRLDLLPAA